MVDGPTNNSDESVSSTSDFHSENPSENWSLCPVTDLKHTFVFLKPETTISSKHWLFLTCLFSNIVDNENSKHQHWSYIYILSSNIITVLQDSRFCVVTIVLRLWLCVHAFVYRIQYATFCKFSGIVNAIKLIRMCRLCIK